MPIDSGGDCFLLGWFSLRCKRGNFSLFLDLQKIQYCSVFGRGRRITVKQIPYKEKKTVILPVIGVCGRKLWRKKSKRPVVRQRGSTKMGEGEWVGKESARLITYVP